MLHLFFRLPARTRFSTPLLSTLSSPSSSTRLFPPVPPSLSVPSASALRRTERASPPLPSTIRPRRLVVASIFWSVSVRPSLSPPPPSTTRVSRSPSFPPPPRVEDPCHGGRSSIPYVLIGGCGGEKKKEKMRQTENSIQRSALYDAFTSSPYDSLPGPMGGGFLGILERPFSI